MKQKHRYANVVHVKVNRKSETQRRKKNAVPARSPLELALNIASDHETQVQSEWNAHEHPERVFS